MLIHKKTKTIVFVSWVLSYFIMYLYNLEYQDPKPELVPSPPLSSSSVTFFTLTSNINN